MLRTFMLATVMATAATLAHADQPLFEKRFDGTIRMEASPAECAEWLPPMNDRASYYIYDFGDGPFAILTRFRDDDRTTSLFLEPTSEEHNARGYSEYLPFYFGSILFYGLRIPVDGEYDFIQTPPTIENNTTFLTLAGKLFDYPLNGCETTVQATLTRNEDFVEVEASMARRLKREMRKARADARKQRNNNK
jgi:hypothetical protein